MTGKAQEIIQWLFKQDRETLFEIKEWKHKRTLSQNAYAWELIGKLSDKMTISKEEMYLKMLKDYGQSIIVSLVEDINPEHYFKYYKLMGKGEINGKRFFHYKIYKGSSEFTTLEMKYFLDGIIHECEQLGIPTLTQEQIEKMKLI